MKDLKKFVTEAKAIPANLKKKFQNGSFNMRDLKSVGWPFKNTKDVPKEALSFLADLTGDVGVTKKTKISDINEFLKGVADGGFRIESYDEIVEIQQEERVDG